MKFSRTLPRTPGPQAPPDPRGGRLYLVRYVDEAGQTYSQTFWKRATADRFQDWVARSGGHANVYSTAVDWELKG